MVPIRAIVDTSILVYLADINQHYPILDLLPNLFERILVPEEVCREFAVGSTQAPHRIPIVNDIETGYSLFEKCTQYDSFTVKTYTELPKIDAGEAEALAQSLEVNIGLVLSDDKGFTASVKSNIQRLSVFNTLHILALLELNNFLTDYTGVVHAVHTVRKIREKSFPLYFREAATYLGIALRKEDISVKTDFLHLGLK